MHTVHQKWRIQLNTLWAEGRENHGNHNLTFYLFFLTPLIIPSGIEKQSENALTDEELLQMMEWGLSDLESMSDEEDDLGSWGSHSGDDNGDEDPEDAGI